MTLGVSIFGRNIYKPKKNYSYVSLYTCYLYLASEIGNGHEWMQSHKSDVLTIHNFLLLLSLFSFKDHFFFFFNAILLQ